jgi:glyoxylase-like metal-dependent hydrolase (beta-lactamase superfamily II)
MADGAPAHVTTPVVTVAQDLPDWVQLVRCDNPGPMTLDGTNTWVLRQPGADRALVVDPGPDEPAHLDAVIAAATVPIEAILVTHGHHDHVGGLARFRSLTGAPVVDTAAGTDEVVLAGLAITILRTPGHTADSICFRVDDAVFTGDTILGRGTTVVAWPDGDLGRYLDSLRRLAHAGVALALPGHGPALTSVADAASYYLKHRLARLDQVRAALAAGAQTVQDVVAVVYADVDRALWPAATWSVQAQLAYLQDREFPDPPGRLSQP